MMREQKRSNREGSVERTPSLRLFYALWPDEPTRARLAVLQAGINGRKVDAANLHLTLAFLGNQPRDSLMLLEGILQSLLLNPFTLTITTYGYFSTPRIVWVGPSSPPEALMVLQSTLWRSLLDNGVPLKPAALFKPHVTLARDAERLDRVWKNDLEWTVNTVALVESLPIPGGVRYRPVATRSF